MLNRDQSTLFYSIIQLAISVLWPIINLGHIFLSPVDNIWSLNFKMFANNAYPYSIGHNLALLGNNELSANYRRKRFFTNKEKFQMIVLMSLQSVFRSVMIWKTYIFFWLFVFGVFFFIETFNKVVKADILNIVCSEH